MVLKLFPVTWKGGACDMIDAAQGRNHLPFVLAVWAAGLSLLAASFGISPLAAVEHCDESPNLFFDHRHCDEDNADESDNPQGWPEGGTKPGDLRLHAVTIRLEHLLLLSPPTRYNAARSPPTA